MLTSKNFIVWCSSCALLVFHVKLFYCKWVYHSGFTLVIYVIFRLWYFTVMLGIWTYLYESGVGLLCWIECVTLVRNENVENTDVSVSWLIALNPTHLAHLLAGWLPCLHIHSHVMFDLLQMHLLCCRILIDQYCSPGKKAVQVDMLIPQTADWIKLFWHC